MKEENMPKADFYTGIGLMAFGILVLILSLQMPTMAEQSKNPYAAPGIVPGLIGAIITFLSGIMFFRAIRRGGHRKQITGEAIKGFFTHESTNRMVKTVLICVLYSLLLGHVNFILLTMLFIFVFVLTKEGTHGSGVGHHHLKRGVRGVLLPVPRKPTVRELYYDRIKNAF